MIDDLEHRIYKILFLHPNFPAQFKHLSRDIAKQGHQVKFLCQTHFGRTVEGVEKLVLKKAAGKEALDKSRDAREFAEKLKEESANRENVTKVA